MKYAIFCLIKGKTEKYHQKLVKEYAKKFKEPYLIRFPLPSHTTLKYPSEISASKMGELEKLLKRFCKNKKKSPISITRIRNFNRKVIVLKVDFSRKALATYRKLMREIEKMKGIKWHKFDKQEKFHATIVYVNNKKMFGRVWKDALKLKPNFKIYFDNLTILRKYGNDWRIYKTFKMK